MKNDPIFLCTLQDDIQAEMTITLLERNHIPVLRKRPGSGEYIKIYMNINCQGVDLYVPEEVHAKAKEVLAESQAVCDDLDKDFEELLKKSRTKKHVRGIVLAALYLGLPALIILLAFLLFN